MNLGDLELEPVQVPKQREWLRQEGELTVLDERIANAHEEVEVVESRS